MYRRVAELTKQKKKHNTEVKDRHGKLLTEEDEVKCRWKEYTEELYDGTGKPLHAGQSLEVEADVQDANKGPLVLYSEFEKALEELKNKKATGPDGIPAELIKALGSDWKRELFEICNEIYISREWPEDFLESIIIPIEKKSGAQECVDFRTISLVSHALTRRLESKAESYLGRDQHGFRRGCGTRDAIAAMSVM